MATLRHGAQLLVCSWHMATSPAVANLRAVAVSPAVPSWADATNPHPQQPRERGEAGPVPESSHQDQPESRQQSQALSAHASAELSSCTSGWRVPPQCKGPATRPLVPATPLQAAACGPGPGAVHHARACLGARGHGLQTSLAAGWPEACSHALCARPPLHAQQLRGKTRGVRLKTKKGITLTVSGKHERQYPPKKPHPFQPPDSPEDFYKYRPPSWVMSVGSTQPRPTSYEGRQEAKFERRVNSLTGTLTRPLGAPTPKWLLKHPDSEQLLSDPLLARKPHPRELEREQRKELLDRRHSTPRPVRPGTEYFLENQEERMEEVRQHHDPMRVAVQRCLLKLLKEKGPINRPDLYDEVEKMYGRFGWSRAYLKKHANELKANLFVRSRRGTDSKAYLFEITERGEGLLLKRQQELQKRREQLRELEDLEASAAA